MKKKLYIIAIATALAACTVVDDGMVADNVTGVPSANDDRYDGYAENPFLDVADYPVSTFSVDADGASYANARRFIEEGQAVPADAVRVEEFINYFTYDYPDPDTGEEVSLDAELFPCPWAADHHLLRVGLKGREIAAADLPPANLVFLVDVSGSMEPADRLPLLKEGLSLMVEGLRPVDRVAIVTYAGRAGVSLPSTACSASGKVTIQAAIARLGTKGATAGAAGIAKAYQIALDNFESLGNNRVILGTDGDFNVGVSSKEELVAIIKEKRKSGVYLTVLGVGRGNLNDAMMEQLADNGNGNYEYISDAAQLRKIFIDERVRFYTVARDCKVQLAFNPARVAAYRLIGYENRVLDQGQFDDDREDAGEIGVGQTITALHELKLLDAPGESLATLSVRYKKEVQALSRLLSRDIPGEIAGSISGNSRFAAAVTGAGLLLKRSAYKGTLDWTMVETLAADAIAYDPGGYRADFLRVVAILKQRGY
ncbi:MAG: von Willebrand factor type A domain-containing protein [Odoribacteraceae bacterium]|jgi:Ca-activated chloride channel family protein|nr:von Willebrand factor type A domain-containing protein [Odoribacteraceae bacterium]